MVFEWDQSKNNADHQTWISDQGHRVQQAKGTHPTGAT